MVFCCNRLEEIGNYKVRRIKDVASMYGDNKDRCGGKWKIHWTKGKNRIKYEGVEG